jgi:hypothetical protein
MVSSPSEEEDSSGSVNVENAKENKKTMPSPNAPVDTTAATTTDTTL